MKAYHGQNYGVIFYERSLLSAQCLYSNRVIPSEALMEQCEKRLQFALRSIILLIIKMLPTALS